MPVNTVSRSHDSPLGPMWSQWTQQGLYRLGWTQPAQADVQQRGESDSVQRWMQTLDEQLEQFYRHGRQSFRELPIDSSDWTPFTAEVYRACREIKPGTTVTYKQLATLAGNPNASRAVGAAMARNRLLLVIPCHRVVSGGGALRGFSAAGGLATKQLLLDLERDGCWPQTVLA